MQTYSLDAPGLWGELERWPHRQCVELMISNMRADGYRDQSIYKAVRTVRRFVLWLDGAAERYLCFGSSDEFVAYRARLGELRNGERATLARLRSALIAAGVISPPVLEDCPAGRVLRQYEASLRQRGYRARSVASHLWFIRPFIDELYESTDGLTDLKGEHVLAYIERRVSDRSSATAAILCSRLRVFLRFLQAEGFVAEDLAAFVPSARNVSSEKLPSHLAPAEVEAVLASCDRATGVGRRDYAVLLLLARLGLRAGEVAALTLEAIDWRSGVLRVVGKGGRSALMPMPQDVGAAVVDYIRNGRPASTSRVIFHRVETPCTAFASATPVILIARRALKRAGIQGVAHRHSHVFRHSLATQMIRSGAALDEIGQVLRHQAPNTARIYAKVDVAALRSLSLPWPEGRR